MHAKESDLPRHTRPSVLAADQPLVVPMLLRISDLKLRGIVVLVVSKTKGITLVFKNDPLESIIVSSTFDSVTSVRSFLQREIENQLRNLFQEDLPVMIHNLSLRHIQSEQEKASKQQHEEWIKAQQLRRIQQEKKQQQQQHQKNLSSNRSVFSDPGMQRAQSIHSPMLTQLPLDTFSMPDLSRSFPYSQFSSPRFSSYNDCATTTSFLDGYGQISPLHGMNSPNAYSSFSDLYFINTSAASNSTSSIPVTAANLSTLNALYSSRFAALKTPPYSDFDAASSKQQLTPEEEEEEDSCPNDASSVNSMIAQEMYAHDVDAPWYVTEGPELPSNGFNEKTTLTMMAMDEDIILNPKENAVAAKLAQLATVNHTISPFAHTIEHFTFRSLPHTVKIESKSKNKKKPRRRIIRWNTTA